MWSGGQFAIALVEQFVRLIGYIAWPGALLIAIWLLKTPIEQLIGRIRLAKWGDREVSFAERVDQVVEEAAAAGITEDPVIQRYVPPRENNDAQPVVRSKADQWWELINQHPDLAVIGIWKEVEQSLRELVAKKGGDSMQKAPVSRLISYLRTSGTDEKLLQLIRELQGLRNIVAHEKDAHISFSAAYEYVALADKIRAQLEEEL
jgi:hypothetical protein